MTRSRRSLLVVAIGLAAIAIYALAGILDHDRYANTVVEELTYFPSGRFLDLASIGYETVACDMLWLKGIQYYGRHHSTDRDYPLAEHIFSTITDLDPQFLGAYRFGAFVLAQDVGQPSAGIELLRKGMYSNPCIWQLPFDLGFLYFTSIRDNVKAAHFFRLASRFADSPSIAKRFTAFAYKKAGRPDVALPLWAEIYMSSTNKVMKDNALYAINSIRLEQTADALTDAVGRFHESAGRYPSTIAELAKVGLVEGIPPDPFGGRYFFDQETKVVLSTTKVMEEAENMRRYLERRVARYVDKRGRFPETIFALKEEAFITEIPVVPGAEIKYDPAGGTVGYVFSWEEPE